MSYSHFDAPQYRMRTLPAERAAEVQHDHLVADVLSTRPATTHTFNVAALFDGRASPSLDEGPAPEEASDWPYRYELSNLGPVVLNPDPDHSYVG